MILKAGLWWLKICNMIRWVVLNVVPNIRRMPSEAYNPECQFPTLKYEGQFVMIWTAISWCSAGPIITLNGRITASDYENILSNQFHLTVQNVFHNNYEVFKMTIPPCTQPEVFILDPRSMTMHSRIFPGQHNCQNYVSSEHCGQV